MIIELFIAMFLVAFIFLFYGWSVRADMYRVVGSTLIFLLGVMLMTSVPSLLGRLEIPVATNITTVGSNTYVEDVFEEYTNHTLGFFIAISGALSLVLILVDRRTARASL